MSLNYILSGTGAQKIVWLHGVLGNSRNFRGLVAKIPATHYLLDARNHGDSFHHPDHSYPTLANDVAKFIQEQRLEGCCVVGHSMGGKTAMQLASDWPKLMSSVVVIDSSSADVETYKPERAALLKDYIGYAAGMNLSQDYSQAKKDLFANIPIEKVAQLLGTNLRYDKDRGAYWRCNMQNIFASYGSIAGPLTPKGRFTGPVLIQLGELSEITRQVSDPEELEANYRAFFDNFQIQIIPNARHWVHADQPQAVADSINAFLSLNQ